VSIACRVDQRLGADRDESGAQKGAQRCRVPGRDLRPDQIAGWDEPETFDDQPVPVTGPALIAGEQFDGELEPANETCAERDESDPVTENPHVAAMMPRADYPGMVSEIATRLENRRPAARAARHQHRVV
jgi:hypothetical protein